MAALLYSLFLVLLHSSFGNSGSYFTWTEYAFSEELAAACAVIDANNDVWLCGGKSSKTSYNSCSKLEINPDIHVTTGYSQIGNRKTIQQSSYFPGYYYSSSGFFCENDNFGGLSFSDPMQSCFLNLDESSNDAKCICCNLDIDTTQSKSKLKCDDLSLVNECKDKFQSCLIYDNKQVISTQHNTILQIGGQSFTTFYDTIDCFNIDAGKYFNSSMQETNSKCNFGKLKYGTKYSGCTLIDNKVIVIGGESSQLNSYMTTIQICENDGNECYESPNNIQLWKGVEQPKVINMDDCIIAIMGGKYSLSIYSANITLYDVCNDELIGYDLLPKPMSEFTLYIGNGYVCTLGGVTTKGSLIKKVYCSPYTYTSPPVPTPKPTTKPTFKPTFSPTTATPTRSPTRSPTMKPTTMEPTPEPTQEPTNTPTHAPTDYIELEDWSEVHTWTSSRSAQACISTYSPFTNDNTNEDSSNSNNDNAMYVFGGIVWNSASSQSRSNSFVKLNNNFDEEPYSVYEYNTMFHITTSMSTFYCKHQCSAYYENKMYLVSPITSNANDIYFYECIIDDDASKVVCSDICSDTSTYGSGICNDIYFEPCVTTNNEYMFIIGGSYSTDVSNKILIWNMKTNEWVNNKNVLNYGRLFESVKAAGCAVYNDTIYTFGGKYSKSITTIQMCKEQSKQYQSSPNTYITQNCTTTPNNVNLKVARYYTQAKTIGQSIVISCGEINITHATSVIEIYDAKNDEIEQGPKDSKNRKNCCVMHNDESVFITGGQIVNYGTSTRRRLSYLIDQLDSENMDLIMNDAFIHEQSMTRNNNGIRMLLSDSQGAIVNEINTLASSSTSNSGSASVLGAQYSLVNDGDSQNTIKELWECQTLQVVSANNEFNSQFFIQSDANGNDGYYVWLDENYNGIYYAPSTLQSWIGGGNVWCYNKLGELKSTYWIKIATSKTRSTRVYIDITCLDKQNVDNSNKIDNNYILGIIPTWAFILIVCLIGMLCLCTFIVFKFILCNKSNNTNSYNSNNNTYHNPSAMTHVPSHSTFDSAKSPHYSMYSNRSQQNSSNHKIQPTVSSNMLFGNPNDPQWQKEARQAVERANESDSEEIEGATVRFDNNPRSGAARLPGDADEGGIEINGDTTDEDKPPPNGLPQGLPKLTPQHLFPDQH